jgi:serine/threonine-protein kinase
VGEHEGQRYYTMPFVESRSLSQLVDSGQWTPGDGIEAARLVAKLAHAVNYAHQAGILHRDLKPGNVLIDANGEPHLADFGLAKRVKGDEHLTLTGDLLGTPAFMAPEQARGKSAHATTSTDIYSLGAVLYYLLTGRPPFVAESPLDALLLVLEAEAVKPRRINPHVPGPLEGICLRCLEKRPEDRYPSAGALAQDLERFLKGEPLAINQKAIGRQLETWARRQPALAARVCTVVVCLGIIMLAFLLHHYESDAQFRAVIGLLLLWLWLSALCQRGLDIDRHAFWVRSVWSGIDPAVLTALLLASQGFDSPLLILFPTLIAASGFWGRASLVATTTATSLLGYILLLWDSTLASPLAVRWLSADPVSLQTRAHFMPLHWHWLALVAILVCGMSVAYLVNRVSALTQFYERRPQS